MVQVFAIFHFLGQSLLLIGKYAESEKALDEGLKATLKGQKGPKDKALHAELERSLKINRLDALVHQKKWAEVVKQSDDLKVNAGEEAKRASFYCELARF